MVLETRASLESGIIGAGHRFAARRLDAQRSVAGWVGEQMGGLSYLDFIRNLVPRVEDDWPSVQVFALLVVYIFLGNERASCSCLREAQCHV